VIGHRNNSQLAPALPYVVALTVTAVFARRTRQPRALAQPFVRGLNQVVRTQGPTTIHPLR
jgi:ABC-type uncharacterized transport system permease subunit